jgi:hypothetical protein
VPETGRQSRGTAFQSRDIFYPGYNTGMPRVAILHQAITTAAMSDNKKRKVESEHRSFKAEWTNKYLFSVFRDKILCLVCR